MKKMNVWSDFNKQTGNVLIFGKEIQPSLAENKQYKLEPREQRILKYLRINENKFSKIYDFPKKLHQSLSSK